MPLSSLSRRGVVPNGRDSFSCRRGCAKYGSAGVPMRRRSSGRRAADAQRLVPAVLPLVVFEAQDQDRLVVIVDGVKLAAAPVRRREIGRVLTELVTKFAVPTRVELHELDGTVLADIVQPPPPEPDPDPEAPPAEPTAHGAAGLPSQCRRRSRNGS